MLASSVSAHDIQRMIELDADNLIDYLASAGRLQPGSKATAQALAWGVSNVVLRVCVQDGEDFVVKQSREKLRTEVDWFSRLDRIWREMDVMQTLSPLLPEGVIPKVLFDDRENFLFGMQAVDADHTVWKADLLAGTADISIAERLGRYLAAIHRETAINDSFRERFGDREVFVQLRVDPFYRHIAGAHPDLKKCIEDLIDEMFSTAVCLVHADFSPKNVLVRSGGISLVDFETAHYGDPAFDLGFFLSHLMLKTVLHADRSREFLQLASTFCAEYRVGLGELVHSDPFGKEALERRTIGHLAGCLLSRIDGTSTIDYLPQQSQQDLVRQFGHRLFFEPPDDLETVFALLETELL